MNRTHRIYDSTKEIPRGLFVAVADVVMGFLCIPRTDCYLWKSVAPFQIPGHRALTIWQKRGWNALQLKGIMHMRIVSSSSPSLQFKTVIEQLYAGQWPVVIKRIASPPPSSVHHHHHHSLEQLYTGYQEDQLATDLPHYYRHLCPLY